MFIFLLVSLLFCCTASSSLSSYVAISVSIPSRQPLSLYLDALSDAVSTSPSFSILVFPEDGVTESFLVPEYVGFVGDVPCQNAQYLESPVVRSLSCEVQKIEKYVVFGLREHGENCSLAESPFCHNDKFFIYNTAIAFGPDGSIVAKYQKHHITGPPFKPGPPDAVFFETDFGIRFGMFICFDIYFHVPAQLLVEAHKITDFVYPTMFWDVQPLTSLPMQQAWSSYFQANLIAANCEIHSRGSGIYTRGEVLIQSRDLPKMYDLLIADVPVIPWSPPPVIPALPDKPFVDEHQEHGLWVVRGSGKSMQLSLNLSTVACSISFALVTTSDGSEDGPLRKMDEFDEEVYVLLYAEKLNDTAELGQSFKMFYCGLVICGDNPKDCFVNSRSDVLFESLDVEVVILADAIRVVEGMVALDQEYVLDEYPKTPTFVFSHDGVRHGLRSTEELPIAKTPILNAGLTGLYAEMTSRRRNE